VKNLLDIKYNTQCSQLDFFQQHSKLKTSELEKINCIVTLIGLKSLIPTLLLVSFHFLRHLGPIS